MVKAIVFVTGRFLASADALAAEFALRRSDVMRRAMQHGLELLRQHLQSGKTDPTEKMSRSASKNGRTSGQGQEKVWRFLGDWEIDDRLSDLCDDALDEDPYMDRETIRKRLEASGIAAEAKDPAAVIDRVLRRRLGVPGGELRPLPGDQPPE